MDNHHNLFDEFLPEGKLIFLMDSYFFKLLPPLPKKEDRELYIIPNINPTTILINHQALVISFSDGTSKRDDFFPESI